MKNHQLFLEGIKYVSERTTRKIRAFIVGDGECRNSIESTARELEIPFIDSSKSEKTVLLTFTSWIKEIDVVLSGSDILTLTSFNEGTPVSLIEAQAANVPIVSTNVGGIENIVIPQITALLCENNNKKDYSEQLLFLVENDSLRVEMSKNGWGHVQEKFHYTRLVSNVEALYKKLLS